LLIQDAFDFKAYAKTPYNLTTMEALKFFTLKQDGIEKVLQGVTDIHQVRVVCIK
jgi:hypothetical protein